MIIIKRIVKAVSTITILSIATRALGFVFRITLSRQIGAEGLGLFQIAMSIFFVLVTITSSGLPITVSRRVSRFMESGDKKSAAATITAAITIGSIFAIFVSLLFWVGKDIFAFIFTDKRCMIMFLCTLPAILLSSVYSSIRGGLWGQKRYFWFSFIEFLQESIMLVTTIILLVGITDPFRGAVRTSVSVSVSYLISTILILIIYLAFGGKFAHPKNELKPLIKHAAPITGIRFAANIENSLVAFIMPAMLVFSGLTKQGALAEYGILMGMVMPLLFLPNTVTSSFSMVLIPEVASLNIKNDEEKIALVFKRAMNLTVIVAGIFLPIYLGVGREIASYIYKNEIAGEYLVKSCWLLIPMGLSQILSTLLNTLECEKKGLRNYLIGAGVLLILMCILPRFFQIEGAIIAFGISASLTAVLHLFTLKKVIPVDSKVYKNLLYVIFLSAPTSFLGFLMFEILTTFLPVIATISISVVVSLLATLGLYAVFNLINFNSIGRLVKKQPKEKTAQKIQDNKKHIIA